MNCFLVVVTGIVAKPIFLTTDYAFLYFAVLNTLCTITIAIYMKETKGLSESQVARLYL
jgi:hypothetical protein